MKTTPGQKRGKKEPAKYRRNSATSRVIPLSREQLERGREIGARVDRPKNPTMLVYYRE